MTDYYSMIFKRKSFHIFRETGIITEDELEELRRFISTVTPLSPEIRTKIIVVPQEETTCHRGAQYCILFYSEQKDGWLRNIGYTGEQIDLYLAENNIGSLWFGIGRPARETLDDLTFVIMIAIAKMPAEKFRKDMFRSKRKPLQEIWQGNLQPYADIVRFAPSACNTQPWLVKSTEDTLRICRYRKEGKRGIMPRDKVVFYNRIDIGIFLFFLETCLHHEGIAFERQLYSDETENDAQLVRAAEYRMIPGGRT